VPGPVARRAAGLPPVTSLFAAFLGFSPVQHLLGAPVLSHLSAANQATLNGRGFFPLLIAKPFKAGLHAAFDFAVLACLVAAGASWLRGGKYIYSENPAPEVEAADSDSDSDSAGAEPPENVRVGG
jgi:hypothetical protein